MRGARGAAAGAPGRGAGRRGGRGARAGATGPSRGISWAVLARLVRLPWRPATVGLPGAVPAGGGGGGPEAGRVRASRPAGSRVRLGPLSPETRESGPPTAGDPGPQPPWCSLRGGSGIAGVAGEQGAGVRALPPGSGDIPPPPPSPPTARPGFPVHAAARSPLVCQPKALSPSYFCNTSGPSTNTASKKTDAELELLGAPRKKLVYFPSGSRLVGPRGELQTRRLSAPHPPPPLKCLVNLNCPKEFCQSPVITGVSS